jgi:hypothetical protein
MESSGRVVWRVLDPEGASRTNAFDAVTLPSDRTVAEPAQHFGCAIPYESERPDEPFALVVRSRSDTGSVFVECEVFAADGTRTFRGWSTDTEVVIVRSPHGLTVTSLPEGEPDPFAPAT